MICSKCNSEIPDSSKFCTNCGATVGAPTENKQFCENCGLELPKGAKFCAVCGAPVNKGASAEVKPFDVLSPVTLGAPVSASTEAKTEALSETGNPEVVPAENVESGYSIPIPTSDTSMPAIDKSEAAPAPASKQPWGNEGELLWQAAENKAAAVSAPTNLESSEAGCIPESNFSEQPTGYSAAAASYSAPAPTPAPMTAPAYTAPTPAPAAVPQNNPMENPFGDYGMGAAAAVVKPIKKKNVAKYILIPVLSVIGAVLIAAGVLFFVNRSLFFNIILGNSGYAAMVEGNSIKEITNKIDMAALSDGIKSATTRSSSAFSGAISGMGGAGYGIAPTGSSYGMANSVASGIDAKAMIESVNKAMSESYGVNSVKVSSTLNVELTDSFKAQLAGLMHFTDNDIDELLKMINNFGFVVDFTSSEKALECGFEMNADGLKLNAKSIVDENGNVYLMLPFVSDKAFMMNVGTASASQAGQVNTVCLELDEKELKRITEKLVNTYLDVYKSCEIKVEDGEIIVAGATAKGKYIKVNFTGAKMAEFATKACEAIADDSYLCGKLAAFLTDCGASMTEEQLKNAIKSVSGMWDKVIPQTCGLVIETVTDNNCKVLAKSYSAINGSETAGKVSFAGDFNVSTKGGKTAAFALEIEEKPVFTLYLEKTSDADGSCKIAVYDNNKKISLTAKYSEVKEATFCGKPITEGKIEISVDVPADFTEDNASFGDISAVINTAKIIVSIKTDGDGKVIEEFALDVPQYGKISMNAEVTAENKSGEISVPSDVIDFTEIGKSMDEIPEEMQKEIIAYLKDMRSAVKGQNAGELGDALSAGLDMIIGVAERGPSADRSDIRELMDDIADMRREVGNFDSQYNNTDEVLSARANALAEDIGKLYSNVSQKGYNMTEDEYNAFKSEYSRYSAVKESLEQEYAAGMGGPKGFGTRADDVAFNELDIDSLTIIMLEYASRYSAAVSMANSAMGANTGELEALLNDAEEKYETAAEDFENLYELYDSGTLNLSFLRKSRKSTKIFAYAVEALENAISPSV